MRNTVIGFLLVVTALAQAQTSDTRLEEEKRLQGQLVAQTYLKNLERLDRIGYALLRVGAPYCSDKRRLGLGMAPINLKHFKDAYVGLMKQAGVTDDLMYPHVVKGTPLDKAGLQAGDKVLKINDESVPLEDKTSQVMWLNKKVHEIASKKQEIQLTVLRAQAELVLIPKPVWQCDINLNVLYKDEPNAMTMIKDISVTTGLMRMLENDDDLALIMGHELGHAILRHTEEKINRQNLNALIGLLGVLSGRSAPMPLVDAYPKDKEKDADYLGLYLSAAAGFDVSHAADVHRNWAAQNPSGLEANMWSTHPSFPERAVLLDAESKVVAEKQRKGERLLPDVSRLKTVYDGDYVTFEGQKKIIQRPIQISGKDLPAHTDVPFLSEDGRIGYQRFSAIKTRPRAFAMNTKGTWVYRLGANAAADAVQACSALTSIPCKLYVVNDDVVWDHTTQVKTVADKNMPPTSDSHPLEKYPASTYATVDDISKIPFISDACKRKYAEWLVQKSPRAYAVAPSGQCFYTWGVIAPTPGDPAIPAERAMAVCSRNSSQCHLYAVDNRVVYKE
jgi:Peptidase family M48/PDZ domain